MSAWGEMWDVWPDGPLAAGRLVAPELEAPPSAYTVVKFHQPRDRSAEQVPQPCKRCAGMAPAHFLTCPTLRLGGQP